MKDRGALTVAEYCAWSRIGRTKVYELINSGLLPVVKVGTKTLIRVSDGQALLDTLVKRRSDAPTSRRNERAVSRKRHRRHRPVGEQPSSASQHDR